MKLLGWKVAVWTTWKVCQSLKKKKSIRNDGCVLRMIFWFLSIYVNCFFFRGNVIIYSALVINIFKMSFSTNAILELQSLTCARNN